MVAKNIEDACKAEGIKVNMVQCKVTEIPLYLDGADLIVTTSQLQSDPGIPVVMGLPFLTGIGKDQALEEILGYLRD
jgi:PTS system galactitol-specific IIB component